MPTTGNEDSTVDGLYSPSTSEEQPLLASSSSTRSHSMLFVNSASKLPDHSHVNFPPQLSTEYVTLDIDQADSDNEIIPHSERKRRRRFSWLSVLLLPGRIALGALTYIAGAGMARRSGMSNTAVITTGCASAIIGQLLIITVVRRHRLREEEEDARAERAREEHMAWFDAIQAVGKIVDRFSSDLPRPAPIHRLFVDGSLLRLLHEKTADEYLSTARSRQSSQAETLERGRHYLRYSIATYGFLLLSLLGLLDDEYNVFAEGSRGIDVAKYMLRLNQEEVLVSLLDGEAINVPRHFVAIDRVKKAIVIAIRGTNSISDIITDLICENAPFAGGYAHSGMKSAAESLFASLLPTLRTELAKRPTFSLVVTGHSLGAGVAILLTKLLLMNGFVHVKCYAIAPCPIFGPMHKIDSEWSDSLECFVHENDLISKLCLASAKRLAMEMGTLHNLPLETNERKNIIKNQNIAKLREVWEEEGSIDSNPLEDEVQQLYIPTLHGIHWLIQDSQESDEKNQNQSQDPTYGSYLVRPRFFENMLLTSNCIRNHFPTDYVKAFAKLPLPPAEIGPPTSQENLTLSWYANELG